MNTLADQVVEFTITLVRALYRVGQLDPAKASFPRARARLWKELVRLQRTQPEIGYVVGPAAVSGGLPELWVDGTSPLRVELRRIVGPSVGGGFILQLLEYLQKRGLVLLSFSRGITEPEWNAFLEVMSEPLVGQNADEEGRRLSRALVGKKVRHVSVVCDSEQPQVQGELPWQIRLAYARLLRDLRAEATTADFAPAKLLEHSERLVAGMAYSYFRKFDVIRHMLFRADLASRLLQGSPLLREVDVLGLLVHGLPVLSLHGTTSLIFKEVGANDQAPREPTATVLRAIAERLLKMPSSRQVDETLRAMCRRQIVPITRLPVELQEWVLAEIWVGALQTDMAAAPPRGSAESSPLRILQKGARYAFTQKLFPLAFKILQHIGSLDRQGVSAVFDVATVETVLEALPTSVEEKREMLYFLEQGGQAAANATASVLLSGEQKVSEFAAWILTQMKGQGIAAALLALDQDIEQEEKVRLLLACVAGKAPESAAPAFVRQLAHKSPRIRRDALTALVSANPAAANLSVARALADPDENVRIRALLLCAASGVGGDQVIPSAINIVSKDARGASPQIVRAAVEVVIRRWEAGALPLVVAEGALCRLAAPVGWFGRFLGRTPAPSAVLITVINALGRLGTERAANLLVKLERNKEREVARAAKHVLDHGVEVKALDMTVAKAGEEGKSPPSE
jgi:HEAT repeat protein